MPRTSGNSSLFDRLGEENEPTRSVSNSGQVVGRVKAIKQNLERVLNTRQGCNQSSPDSGLIDFNDAVLGSSDLLNRISMDIRRVIQQNEPRVRVIDVKAMTDVHAPTNLSFRIDCLVPVKDKKEVIEIDLVMNAGQFKVF
ncbi:MAG: type VI secretion system baseplate subunit TssE [Saezia sp.]